ncbi:MAG: peptidoglycan-binding protein [Pseudomonadota bacterium]|nr:peptidoglycan-binding protein [Pseudomonadota bacterium]
MSNPLYDLMHKGESGAAGYNAYNRGTAVNSKGQKYIVGADRDIDFSTLTLGQVSELQHLGRRDPDRVFAVGKYQIIPDTMDGAIRSMGLDRNQQFTPELQDRIFSEYLIVSKRPDIHAYITGKPGATLEKAQFELSREWASFSDPRKGDMQSHYGSGNRAHISLKESSDALTSMRTEYAQNIGNGMSPKDAWASMIGSTQSQGRSQASPSVVGQVPSNNAANAEPVMQTQAALTALGYLGKDGKPLAHDGIHGPNTDHAVREFQQTHGLAVDGIVGPHTLRALEHAKTHPLVSEASHPNHGLYKAIAEQLPAGTDPKVAANVTLQARENGITSPGDLRGVHVNGSDVFVLGNSNDPGQRARVDLQAPTPDMQSMSDHMAQQTAQAQQAEQQRAQQMSMPR